MAVNLNINKESMLEAWKQVVDDKSATDWALYGYDKQSNDLKLVSTGEDGLEELADEFNSGKMMYAFCRVIDPKTSLPKFVLINWQGEGAPTFRKGNCAHHIHDIKQFFKGAHITVNARTDDEVDPEIIMEKVSKSTGSSYSFKERASSITETEDTASPVMSVYRKIKATSEIDTKQRDKFWEKLEVEEKSRIELEQKKKNQIRVQQEQERKDREIKEAEAREELVRERSRSINEIRKAEKIAEASYKATDQEKWNKQFAEDMKDADVRRQRSESLRQERNMEVQQLIGQRTSDARAIFEQNTSAGQMVTRKNSSSSYRRSSESAVSPTVVHDEPLFIETQKKTEEVKVDNKITEAKTTSTEKSNTNFNYTKNLLADGLPPRQSTDDEQEDDSNWDEPPLEDPPVFQNPLDIMKNENSPSKSAEESPAPVAQKEQQSDKGLVAKAMYDYQAEDENEISFDPGDLITNIEKIDEGWWHGVGPDGSSGLFPANYVETL